MTTDATGGRAYARTHPWLTFSFDLRRLKHTDWLALGEAASMSGHVAGTALDPAVAEEPKKDLYMLASAMNEDEIHPEVREKLDRIAESPGAVGSEA